jgi:hypothetical protein
MGYPIPQRDQGAGAALVGFVCGLASCAASLFAAAIFALSLFTTFTGRGQGPGPSLSVLLLLLVAARCLLVAARCRVSRGAGWPDSLHRGLALRLASPDGAGWRHLFLHRSAAIYPGHRDRDPRLGTLRPWLYLRCSAGLFWRALQFEHVFACAAQAAHPGRREYPHDI